MYFSPKLRKIGKKKYPIFCLVLEMYSRPAFNAYCYLTLHWQINHKLITAHYSLLSGLLLPFSWIYGAIAVFRNFLYDSRILRSYSFPLPVIGIGNLSTGGTGKTPMAEYTIQLLLEKGYSPALLSRGYGRKTTGYLLADDNSDATLIGDEPYQVYRKFEGITVAVCEDRVKGIQRILKDKPGTNVIVLDDCYQHRRLKAGFYILLTDFAKPYFKDFMLPSGRLREPMSGKKRADVIIMTKCPSILVEQEKIKLNLQQSAPQSVFFTGLKYFTLQKTNSILPAVESLNGYTILAFSGIATPEPFISYLKEQAGAVEHLTFPDHHIFSKQDIEKIISGYARIKSARKIILTTEKDWRRLEKDWPVTQVLPIYYLPVGMDWDELEKRIFDARIIDYVSQATTNSRLH
jgi:tetraacyldisaccharide 4'-kinase